ncbi:hypothetical protein [Mycolicibacterium sp.]|uniref:hypothetical protein n=1 Tax=Mycolicibacterium sp. TaxID=2320850 RepID=UPI003D107C24
MSNNFGKPGNQVTRDLDSDLDSITVVHRREGLLKHPAHMKRDAIRRLGCV